MSIRYTHSYLNISVNLGSLAPAPTYARRIGHIQIADENSDRITNSILVLGEDLPSTTARSNDVKVRQRLFLYFNLGSIPTMTSSIRRIVVAALIPSVSAFCFVRTGSTIPS